MSTQHTRRALLVVRADLATQANARAAEVDTGGAGDKTFTVGLVPIGSAPGTAPVAYWASWQMRPAQYTAIKNRLESLPNAASKVRVYDADQWTPEAVLADLGFERAQGAEA